MGPDEITPEQRLRAIERLVRSIVYMDASELPVPRRETLVGHLTGALFVYGERPYALSDGPAAP